MRLELAKAILAKGKALVPDRFPAPNLETATAWAEALSVVSFPDGLWREAVNLWATSLVTDRMCTPRDIKDAAYVVRDRWEGSPELAAVLGAHRAARLDANYVRMGLEPVSDSPAVGAKSPPDVKQMFGLPPAD